MVIDAQAIEHLEILEASSHGHSLLSYLTQNNSTPFGKRLLKHWVVGPLKDASKIEARLDAVEEFKSYPNIREEFTKSLSKFPDLERIISRIYTYSVRTSVKAIYIDMAALQRLDEFYELLKMLRNAREIIEKTFKKAKLKSKRLKELT
jgi:DNA mismatch repair protein MSH6